MKNFILIHGAWHGRWCWEDVANSLRNFVIRALSIDLPGHYTNKTDFNNINLNSYVQYVNDFIKTIEGKVTLVGIVISQVAENNSDKIDSLIYVSAFIPDYTGSFVQEEKNQIIQVSQWK